MAYSNLTAPRDNGVSEGKVIALAMDAVKIYKGSLVQINSSGYATYAVAASRPFAGVAIETIDNSSGTAGAKKIRVSTTGVHDFAILSGESVGQAHIGTEVYWNDGSNGTPATVSLSDQGVGPKVGRLVEVVSSTRVRVRIDGYAFVVAGQAN